MNRWFDLSKWEDAMRDGNTITMTHADLAATLDAALRDILVEEDKRLRARGTSDEARL